MYRTECYSVCCFHTAKCQDTKESEVLKRVERKSDHGFHILGQPLPKGVPGFRLVNSEAKLAIPSSTEIQDMSLTSSTPSSPKPSSHSGTPPPGPSPSTQLSAGQLETLRALLAQQGPLVLPSSTTSTSTGPSLAPK